MSGAADQDGFVAGLAVAAIFMRMSAADARASKAGDELKDALWEASAITLETTAETIEEMSTGAIDELRGMIPASLAPLSTPDGGESDGVRGVQRVKRAVDSTPK